MAWEDIRYPKYDLFHVASILLLVLLDLLNIKI